VQQPKEKQQNDDCHHHSSIQTKRLPDLLLSPSEDVIDYRRSEHQKKHPTSF